MCSVQLQLSAQRSLVSRLAPARRAHQMQLQRLHSALVAQRHLQRRHQMSQPPQMSQRHQISLQRRRWTPSTQQHLWRLYHPQLPQWLPVWQVRSPIIVGCVAWLWAAKGSPLQIPAGAGTEFSFPQPALSAACLPSECPKDRIIAQEHLTPS